MPPHRRVLRRYTTDRPEVHDAIAKMRQLIDQYPDRILIGEAHLPLDRLVTYYGPALSGLHLPFNFQLLKAEWQAQVIAELARSYEAALPAGAWPNWVLGNHDTSRVASRVGAEQARLAGLLLLTLRGTPTLYYGDELGMRDAVIPPELVRDPFEKNVPGLGLGRDPERTPMQWTAGPNAGFGTGTPWLPIAGDAATVNVETERDDPSSMLSFYRALLRLRRAEDALSVGSYSALELGGDVLGFERFHQERRLTILLNFSASTQLTQLELPGSAEVIFSTCAARCLGAAGGELRLAANEGVVIRNTR
jgi:alpha-glucosidase